MSRRRPTSARSIAREVLGRVDRAEAYANLALAAALERSSGLALAERALATELVYGVLRQRRRLDHALCRHMTRPLKRVDREVLEALRVAAYQILFLDRVPAHAAVDEAVGAVRQLRGPKVGGFANAVLRKLCAADLTAGLPSNPAERDAVTLSLPDELLRALVADLGQAEAERLGQALLGRAALCLRVNRTRAATDEVQAVLEGEGARVEAGRWIPDALRMAGVAQPFGSRSYLEGLWSAQDEAAQLAALVLEPRAGEEILDACAGVGGKSTQLAEILQLVAPSGAGSLLSVDSSERKLELLQEHCRRLGLHSATRCADLTQADALCGRSFDKILLDAPCSGLGVLRRHPELKWRWRPGQIDELVALQRRLLENVVRALRPGGVLVYSVCTVSAAEGPQQLDWLLRRFPELKLQPPGPAVPAALQQDGVVRAWPHRHDIDGFFVARVGRQ